MNKLIVIIFLSWIGLGWATNHYVDKYANGNNNGTSWSNAWESFSDIEWNQIQPGDIVYISGGTDSTVYNENLSIGANGTAGNLVTITGAYDEGHDGKVIIQGSGWSGTGVSCTGDSYIRIANVHIRLWYVGINGGNSNVLYWDSVYVNKCQWAASPSTQGNGSDSVFIRWSRIVSDSTTATQTDALSCTNVTNLEVSNCYIYQGNRYASSGHSDIMQVRQSGRQLYYNNWFEEEGSGLDSSAAAGLNGQINYSGDSTLFYNNVMIKRGWSYNTYMDQGNTGHVWMMYNNTFINEYTYGDGGVYQTQQVYSFSKNNIYMSLSDYGSMNIGASLNPSNANFDYNQYYSPNASGIFGTNNPASFSWWQGQGGDLNGAEGNPLFTDLDNLDVTLQIGSPCIDAGTADVKAYIESYQYSGGYLPWTDYNGNTRSETTPSIGAYEYGDRGPDITPPEVTGAVLLDSATLKIMFSELLDETTAEDENNYSISNNIDIFNASLSGSEVTLQTTIHSPGSYIVTVVNVEDLAGNPINQSNTAEYSLIHPDSLIKFAIENVQGVIQNPEHTPLKTIDGLGALDGDPDSRWAAEPIPEELIFDLGTNRTVLKTKLSFYRWNFGRVYSYSISISSDNNNNWVTIVSQATSASNEEWTIDEFQAEDARYVKVDFINNNQSDWAGLWEGEIWGINSTVTVIDPINNGLPNEFALHQNYPNPFNPSTTISYSIPASSFVTLKVYDVLGNEVATLVNAEKPEGSYEVKFSTVGGSTSGGDSYNLPSGIYFYRLQARDFVQVKKMILLK